MIDLETLSTSPNAVILTIGALKFKRHTRFRSSTLPSFYRRIEIQSCIDLGLDISSDTEKWWSMQNNKARHEAFEHKDRIPLVQALEELSEWFRGSKYIWSHGATFDCVILEQAYYACDLTVPWMFCDVRDTRTLYDVTNVKLKDFPIKVEHHALYDAYRQVQAVIESLKRINDLKT